LENQNIIKELVSHVTYALTFLLVEVLVQLYIKYQSLKMINC